MVQPPPSSADQNSPPDPTAAARRQRLPQCMLAHPDLIGGGVRPDPNGAEHHRQQLAGTVRSVIHPPHEGWNAKPYLQVGAASSIAEPAVIDVAS